MYIIYTCPFHLDLEIYIHVTIYIYISVSICQLAKLKKNLSLMELTFYFTTVSDMQCVEACCGITPLML